jgi:hypothetical protein
MGGTLDENQSSNVLRRTGRSAHVRIPAKAAILAISGLWVISERTGSIGQLFALRNKPRFCMLALP